MFSFGVSCCKFWPSKKEKFASMHLSECVGLDKLLRSFQPYKCFKCQLCLLDHFARSFECLFRKFRVFLFLVIVQGFDVPKSASY